MPGASHRHPLPSLALLAVLLGSSALAGGPVVLSYDEALRRALEHNPDLLSSGQDVRSAEGALVAAPG